MEDAESLAILTPNFFTLPRQFPKERIGDLTKRLENLMEKPSRCSLDAFKEVESLRDYIDSQLKEAVLKRNKVILLVRMILRKVIEKLDVLTGSKKD